MTDSRDNQAAEVRTYRLHIKKPFPKHPKRWGLRDCCDCHDCTDRVDVEAFSLKEAEDTLTPRQRKNVTGYSMIKE